MTMKPRLAHIAKESSPRANSRQAILLAAERIFARAGLEGARTGAIAAEAGVNKALLYYYFKSKDALYLAILEHHMKEFNRAAVEVLRGDTPARAKMLAYVAMHFDFVSARPFFTRLFPRLLVSEGSFLERLAKKYMLPVIGELIRVIEQGVRTREFRPVDAEQTALSMMGLTVHYFLMAPLVQKVAHVDPYARSRLARRKKEILEFVRYGVFRHPEARWS
jgi:TetR/AcrR family transcriptional regulator